MRRIVLLAMLVGCGPQLDRLVSQRHYREAVCAAHDGSSGDRTDVRRALATDAAARVHVEMVRAEHLERVLGGGAGDVLGRTRFARVRVQTDVLPVDELRARVAINHVDGTSASVPVTWSALAAATGERLPPPRTYWTYAHRGTALRLVGAFFTFGMSLPFTRFHQRPDEVDAPDSEYLARAPRAHALHAAMRDRGCSVVPSRVGGGVGATCEWFIAIAADAPRELALDVTLGYVARRKQHRYAPERSCIVEDTASIALGRVPELEYTTARRFGSRMRTLAELTR